MNLLKLARSTNAAFPLRGSIALITGGGRGVGRLFALRLAAEGATVVLVARSADELDEVADCVESSGGHAKTFVVDVTDIVAVQNVVARIEKQVGPIDVLINNAGIFGPIGNTWECDWQAWWKTIEVNLGGAVAFSHSVIPHMASRRRGRIVNMASQAGAFRWPTVSAYSVSKDALIKFSENLALECNASSIRVFAYHPGLLPLGMTLQGKVLEGATNHAQARVGAWCRAQLESEVVASEEDAADKLVMLLSGKHDVLTGRYITVWDDLDVLAERVGDASTDEYKNYLMLRPQRWLGRRTK
jgi:NAD(P)-dependent dehydrogenase (short-subunit alcohol dehydrogenase family)